MVFVTLVVIAFLVSESTILPSVSLVPDFETSERLFLTVIVGITSKAPFAFPIALTTLVGVGVWLTVALGVGVTIGVGVVKLSTSSSFGETLSCLVRILGNVFLDRV